jgi:hypothetical protein
LPPNLNNPDQPRTTRGCSERIQKRTHSSDPERPQDIPATEQLFADGRTEFLKAASSAAHVYGRELVSAESFVHFGLAYKSTPESLERDVNRLVSAGVNQIVYHGFPYVYLDRPEPGWHPFVDPASFSDHFNDHNLKIWPAIPALNAYISRLQLIARRATPVARYAVYTPDLDYLKWVNGPTRASIDYDYVDDDVLAKSKVRQGKLVVPSGAEYETLVLPVDKKELRDRFPGLRIVIGDIPADQVPARWRFGNAEFRFWGRLQAEIGIPPAALTYRNLPSVSSFL